jgi:2,4-diaminopentanoate dehydrogenase
VRFTIEGIVAGAPRIVVEHVTRLTQAAAPDWPYPPEGRPGVHRVIVTGDPGVELETYVGLGGDVNEAGVTATAARVVNAIHAVCDAEPGLLSVTHLPLAHVAGVMHP